MNIETNALENSHKLAFSSVWNLHKIKIKHKMPFTRHERGRKKYKFVLCGKEEDGDEGRIQLYFLMETNEGHNSSWRHAFSFVALQQLKEKLQIQYWKRVYGLPMDFT
jgi:hypothetical protein